jgi:TonB family protein
MERAAALGSVSQPANTHYDGRRHGETLSKLRNALITLVVGLGHAALVSWLILDPVPVRRLLPEPKPLVMAFISPDDPLRSPSWPALAITDPLDEFEAPSFPLDAIELETEAPRIDPELRLDISPYSERAGLSPGSVVTVILLLQIAADGTVISAKVIRSNGDDPAVSAAIEYARATRWIPGTVDGQPSAMQASLAVILGEHI